MKKLILVIILLIIISSVVFSQKTRVGGRSNVGGKSNLSSSTIPSNFVEDSFTDSEDVAITAHTGEIGATWVQHSCCIGNISIHSNMADKDATSNAAFFTASGIPPSTDYTVEGEIIELTSEARSTRICGWTDTTNLTGVCAGRINSTTLELGKFINGTFTSINQDTITFSTNQVRVIKITRTGTNYEWFVDGTSSGSFSITDAELSGAGKVAVRMTGTWADNSTYPLRYIKAYP